MAALFASLVRVSALRPGPFASTLPLLPRRNAPRFGPLLRNTGMFRQASAVAIVACRILRTVDEEDVVLSAFNSFCARAKQGKFRQLEDSEDLWQLLVVITQRKAINRYKRATRYQKLVAGESSAAARSNSSAAAGHLARQAVAGWFACPKQPTVDYRDSTQSSSPHWRSPHDFVPAFALRALCLHPR